MPRGANRRPPSAHVAGPGAKQTRCREKLKESPRSAEHGARPDPGPPVATPKTRLRAPRPVIFENRARGVLGTGLGRFIQPTSARGTNGARGRLPAAPCAPGAAAAGRLRSALRLQIAAAAGRENKNIYITR